MAVARRLLLVAVLLLFSSGLHRSSPPPACAESCTCRGAPLLNCSSSGLSSVPRHIQDSVTLLDLSHNLLSSVTLLRAHRNLRNVWLGNNSIAHLSLCIARNVGSQNATDRHVRRLGARGRRGCVSWAPSLQLLSVERNQLEQLPAGLEGSESLQVLQLSFNRIATLRPGDVRDLPQLRELHLQHNLIASVEPLMFQDLAQLRVLDLSFNLLTSLHPLTYPSLRNIGADVRLHGNRWYCDCSLRGLRRRMVYDDSRGLPTWRVLCDSPPMLSGKDLLQLEEDDLNCLSTENMSGLHRDVSVYSGSEILLSCSTQDPVWWTPSGQTSVSQPQVISDITDRDTGLYVCVSEDHRVVSVFNLQISKVQGTRRNTRSLPGSNQQVTPRNSTDLSVPQSQLTLAVCLSVFITFLVAFILGVLARPCIDVLWKRVTTKKRSSAANSGSSVEQRQYDNEAFSGGEEPGQTPAHRERRVTFSAVDIRDENNVHYYDAGAGGGREDVDKGAAAVCVVRQTAGHLGSEVVTSGGRTHGMEFEPIPDPGELEERSLSSCSDSSLSDKVSREKQMTQRDATITKSPQLEKESVQQRPEVPQISIEGTGGIPEFTSEPFTDWSPHANNKSKDFDLWQEKEEQFEFSDSVRSTSERSSVDMASTSHKHKRAETSSSSSYVSDDEPTQYTVNSDHEEDGNKKTTHRNNDIQRRPARPELSSSSDSSGSDCKPVKNTGVRKQKEERKDTSTSGGNRVDRAERNARVPSLSSNSSSSSDSEDETSHRIPPGKMNIAGLPFQESPSPTHHLRAQFPAVDLEHIPRVRRRLDIKAPSLGSDSSSCSDSENEIDRPRKVETGRQSLGSPGRQQTEGLSPASTSSSSSDSEDEALGHTEKPRPGKVDVTYKESQTPGDPVKGWSVIDLEHIPHIKRRLDVKALSPAPDSSSSTEDEVTNGLKNHDLDIKSHLNSKAPSTDSDSSSSSDSEDEITNRTGKREIAELPLNDRDAKWPALDFGHVPRIRKCLDIKAPPLASDSSSSSDSEDEVTTHTKNLGQGEVHVTRLPGEISQTARPEPETRWPTVDLEQTTHIKRRLDIKAPSPDSDSSSSSDSEEEITSHTGRPTKLDTAEPPAHARWPALDCDHLPRIERRLDVKAPSPASDSSSSSDSEDEAVKYIKKTARDQIHEAKPAEIPQNVRQETESDSSSSGDSADETADQNLMPRPPLDAKWPTLDLERVPHIKRRLDIETLPSPPRSSPNSEIEKHETSEVHMSKPPLANSETDVQAKWPALDFENISLKRRLDIKAPSQDSESSSSSDGEIEATHHTEKPEKLIDLKTQWPTVNLGNITGVKKRLDIKSLSPPHELLLSGGSKRTENRGDPDKIRPYYTSSSSDEEGILSKPPINVTPDPKWPELDLGRATRVKRRLDIKARAPSRGSGSSSGSEAANLRVERDRRDPRDVGIKQLDQDTTLDDLTVGIRHVTRRLDVKARPSSDLPAGSQRSSSDSSSSDSEDEETNEVEVVRLPKSPLMNMSEHPKKKPSVTLEKYTVIADSSSSTATNDNSSTTAEINPELQSRWTTMNLGISRFRKRLEITSHAPPSSNSGGNEGKSHKTHNEEMKDQLVESDSVLSELRAHSRRESSSSSTSEDETTRHSAGVPRIKRYLNIKAPSPDQSDSSSSCSEGEGQVKRLATGESRHGSTDSESVITYKRSIMKAPSLPGESQATTARRHETGVPSLNFDDVVKKRINHYKGTTGLDVPPQIRWPGLSRHLSDLSVYSSGKNLDVDAPSPTPEPDSPTGRTNEILKTLSEEKMEKKGLSALKVMSSERRTWDSEPLDLSPLRDTSFNHRRFEEDAKQPLKQFHVSSTSTDEKRAADLLYGIRSYRRRDSEDTEPPQEAPPPVPETPPPDEAAELTWRSPQRSGATSRTEEGSFSLTPQSLVHYFDSSKMNTSDV